MSIGWDRDLQSMLHMGFGQTGQATSSSLLEGFNNCMSQCFISTSICDCFSHLNCTSCLITNHSFLNNSFLECNTSSCLFRLDLTITCDGFHLVMFTIHGHCGIVSDIDIHSLFFATGQFGPAGHMKVELWKCLSLLLLTMYYLLALRSCFINSKAIVQIFSLRAWN